MLSQPHRDLAPAACPETRLLARRILASRGRSPFAADRPVELATRLLSEEAQARAGTARQEIATAAALVVAALLLLASATLRQGGDPARLGLELLAACGAGAWGFALIGAAADRHGRAAALRTALRRPRGLGHAFRIGLLLGAPTRPA